jgi:hypothetical protein
LLSVDAADKGGRAVGVIGIAAVRGPRGLVEVASLVGGIVSANEEVVSANCDLGRELIKGQAAAAS